MDSDPNPPKSVKIRHKCSACYKQYNKKEHLVEHMKVSFHSVHQPKCGICKKHCKSFESLREHSKGLLAKDHCSRMFHELGCDLCMKVFCSPILLSEHKWTCQLLPPTPLGTISLSSMKSETSSSNTCNGDVASQVREAVALDCEMVGGGSDGTLSLCGRVCLIDESEDVIFHAYVQPQMPVTDYRSEVTGLTEEHLKDAMPLKEVQQKIQEILYNGESIGIARIDGGKAKLLVGHSLEHDLDCLRITYPDHLIRDTAKYQPLMKTNLVSHSLKYLTKTYLGQIPPFLVWIPSCDIVDSNIYPHFFVRESSLQSYYFYAILIFDPVSDKPALICSLIICYAAL
ncbi:uncharacterized protein LOC130828244 isoform X2 [Amaranthus tricolor]|uniref:uncharacterized protein LOC130828244 isoform X2 n=1 Tax=Amaranthus tricolor TaxID=29722 RepID=UPI002586A555|nr:uncharacterized protein LOC130828244 isoform X2 [Amaranthus tricolor]